MEWLDKNPFHRRALEIAHRAGSFDLAARYIEGDMSAVLRIARHFNLYAALLGLPENRQPLTQGQLVEILTAMMGGKK